MSNIFKNILKNSIVVSLLVSLLFPYAQNLLHLIDHHHHEIKCDNNNTVHLHEITADCDFDQFYTSPRFVNTDNTFYSKKGISIITTVISFYKKPFITKYSLKNIISRGPPQV